MKRIPLVTLLVVALAMVLAGCGLLSQKTEPPNPTAPVKEVKMVHPTGIPVLMYHKIGDDKDNDAVIREDLFREQMKFLKDNGYNPLTMDQLYDYGVNGAAVPEKPVVLTFDDGYADTYSIVYPIMKEYGFAATVFINPGDVGTRLTWDQIREMHKNGITISNHGFQHIEMGQLSEAKQIENITKHIDDDIWELRPGNNRVLYFYFKNDTFVLLHQFRKKTQKTPKREIDKAKAERDDYLARKEAE